MLGLASAGRADASARLIVLRPAGGDVYALAVDRIHDHEELVVKPAAPAVMATGLYAGTTLADDGSPILLFDPPAWPRSAASGSKRRSAPRASPTARRRPTAQATEVLLFRGLDGGRRRIRLALVDRIEEVPAERDPQGRRPASRPARRSDPAARRRDRGSSFGSDKVRLFRLNDGSHEIGYAFAEVIDLATIDHEVIHGRSGRARSAAVTLIGGEPAELVDAHWLFANHVGAPRGQASSRWSAACPATIRGCRTCFARSSRPPAIGSSATATTSERRPGDRAQGQRRCAERRRRRARSGCAPIPRREGKKDDSIYRYDRAGLLMALEERSAGRGR